MILPADFQYSQARLQDYVDCPRRFLLRYVLRRAWPAPDSVPMMKNEQRMEQGKAFHRLVHQHILGLPVEQLAATVTDPDVLKWWDNYLVSPPAGLPETRFPEMMLSAPVAGRRLVAKYDLVAVDEGKSLIIVDWKTSIRRPRRQRLAEALQTRVYPYLLARAGAGINGGHSVRPEQVEMVYWYAQEPYALERFSYDDTHFAQDEEFLTALIEGIELLSEKDFNLSSDDRICKYCRYRSLCDRGDEAGFSDDPEESTRSDDLELDLDFEQIPEVDL
ncbi:MAG: PD-(D/E)XK nuclease family protein [Anaerolineae bacterium]|nr:PD-(D/E)XK nuclease family protein [Anaerolineae bacterium]